MFYSPYDGEGTCLGLPIDITAIDIAHVVDIRCLRKWLAVVGAVPVLLKSVEMRQPPTHAVEDADLGSHHIITTKEVEPTVDVDVAVGSDNIGS